MMEEERLERWAAEDAGEELEENSDGCYHCAAIKALDACRIYLGDDDLSAAIQELADIVGWER